MQTQKFLRMKKLLFLVCFAFPTLGYATDSTFQVKFIEEQPLSKRLTLLKFLNQNKDSVFVFHCSKKKYVEGQDYVLSFNPRKQRKKLIMGKLSTFARIKEI